jgi:hypothetical protein
MAEFLIHSDNGEGKKAFYEFAKAGNLELEDFDKRFLLWRDIYNGILKSVFVTEELSPSEANVAFGIGLSVWGVSEAKAKKLISRPLAFGPTE